MSAPDHDPAAIKQSNNRQCPIPCSTYAKARQARANAPTVHRHARKVIACSLRAPATREDATSSSSSSLFHTPFCRTIVANCRVVIAHCPRINRHEKTFSECARFHCCSRDQGLGEHGEPWCVALCFSRCKCYTALYTIRCKKAIDE